MVCSAVSHKAVTYKMISSNRRFIDPSVKTVPIQQLMRYCAANFSFAQLAKRKSLGRRKPATNSQAQALQHTVWNVSTISKPY